MNVYESPAVIEERVAREVVARHPLPEVVANVAVEFGIDYSDTPAMWLVFTLRPDLVETQETYSSVYAFMDEIREELRNAGVERFAFARFKRPVADDQT